MMWGIFSRWSGALIMASTVCIFAGSTVLDITVDWGRMKDICTCTTPAHLCLLGSLSEDERGRPSTANSGCYQAFFKKFLTDRHKALLKAPRSKLFGVGGKADQVEVSGLQKMIPLKYDSSHSRDTKLTAPWSLRFAPSSFSVERSSKRWPECKNFFCHKSMGG